MSPIESWKNQPTWVKKFTIIAPLVAGIMGIITGLTPAVDAWDGMGLPTVAMRGYVRSETKPVKDEQRQTTKQVMDLQIELAQGKRDQNLIARNKLEIEIPAMATEQQKIRAQQEIRRLDDDISALDEQLRTLRRIRTVN